MPPQAAEVIMKSANEVLAMPQFQQALLKLMVAPAKRILGDDANALTASQLVQFRKTLAAKPVAQ